MTAEILLECLKKVKQTGPQKWKACCPAHDDKHPSLTIRELDNGVVLIRCHSVGCSVHDIVHAVGLDLTDLFPKQASHHLPKVRKPWNASDVLSALAYEILIAYNMANKMANGESLFEEERKRLSLCATRLLRGMGVANE